MQRGSHSHVEVARTSRAGAGQRISMVQQPATARQRAKGREADMQLEQVLSPPSSSSQPSSAAGACKKLPQSPSALKWLLLRV